MKALLIVLLLAVGALAQPNHLWLMEADTISDTAVTDTILYGGAWSYSAYENIRWLIKVADTSSAAFSGDSIEAIVGYQMGTPTYNYAGTLDTFWRASARVPLDTCISDSLGTANGFDTLTITGFSVSSKLFTPDWDVLVRPYVEVQANNNPQRNIWVIENHRRRASKVAN